MPNRRTNSKSASSKQMIKTLCRLGAKRSLIRKKAAALLTKINAAERPEKEDVAHELTSPNIHRHYLNSTFVSDVLEGMMGHMIGGVVAIMAYDSYALGKESVCELAVAWCAGAAVGTFISKGVMKFTGWSFTKNTCDLKALNDKHDALQQKIQNIRSR